MRGEGLIGRRRKMTSKKEMKEEVDIVFEETWPVFAPSIRASAH